MEWWRWMGALRSGGRGGLQRTGTGSPLKHHHTTYKRVHRNTQGMTREDHPAMTAGRRRRWWKEEGGRKRPQPLLVTHQHHHRLPPSTLWRPLPRPLLRPHCLHGHHPHQPRMYCLCLPQPPSPRLLCRQLVEAPHRSWCQCTRRTRPCCPRHPPLMGLVQPCHPRL